MTGFVGRRDELAEVRRAVERSRLVTLCGPGGVGKTRLTLRAAAGLRAAFEGGAWLVELSALRDPGLLARTVAETLRLPDVGAGDPVDLLAEHLASRHLLLVLDTCEHLLDGCALLAEVLVRAAPRLHVIATSREPLNVIGEHILPVGPLAVPPEDAADPETCDAVRLFTERAAAVRPGFAVTGANRAAVARLCRRLDGIPLALELAAVRLRAMSVDELDERLSDRFRLLGPTRGGQLRHQTLHTAITWSHDLCTGAERLLWSRLSVFPGDFDLTAAERICADADLPAGTVFGLLTRLVEKSVLQYEEDRRRYRMLDTLREYGAERLEGADEVRRRHREHYAALAERVAANQLGPEQLAWFGRLRDEQANLRVALEWSLSTPDEQEAGVRLALRLAPYWYFAGLFGEARSWYERAAEACDDGPERAWTEFWNATYAIQQGDLDPARDVLEGLLVRADELRDPDLLAHAHFEIGLIRFYEGDLEEAVASYEQAELVWDRIGYRNPIALNVHYAHAGAHALLGDFRRALDLCARSLEVCARTGERWTAASAVWMRGTTHWLKGDGKRAEADIRESLRVKAACRDLVGIVVCLDLMGACAITAERPERAAVLCGAGEQLWHLLGSPIQRGTHYLAMREALVAGLRDALGGDRVSELFAKGAALEVEDAAAFALGDDDLPAARRPGPDAPDAAPEETPLTRRELEIADLVAEGLTNREIAERLVIAKRTVDSHLEHILGKLGFTSRTRVAAWAIERRTAR
ncbi:ATP-binding protein [Actinomadura rupiterrae]|uniref:ATP-binding protein n=1 Tax=Actinomadura rupiterrae TaxID=559627 RepID=UPI0020A2EA72|nr:LuxR C-terminal-related transcriptional regulator [Actinomadura rupiterrae]